eukprot:gene31560-38985_t
MNCACWSPPPQCHRQVQTHVVNRQDGCDYLYHHRWSPSKIAEYELMEVIPTEIR